MFWSIGVSESGYTLRWKVKFGFEKFGQFFADMFFVTAFYLDGDGIVEFEAETHQAKYGELVAISFFAMQTDGAIVTLKGFHDNRGRAAVNPLLIFDRCLVLNHGSAACF